MKTIALPAALSAIAAATFPGVQAHELTDETLTKTEVATVVDTQTTTLYLTGDQGTTTSVVVPTTTTVTVDGSDPNPAGEFTASMSTIEVTSTSSVTKTMSIKATVFTVTLDNLVPTAYLTLPTTYLTLPTTNPFLDGTPVTDTDMITITSTRPAASTETLATGTSTDASTDAVATSASTEITSEITSVDATSIASTTDAKHPASSSTTVTAAPSGEPNSAAGSPKAAMCALLALAGAAFSAIY